MGGWGGGGVIFFLHFMLIPTFLEEKNRVIKYIIFFRKTIIFHLMFSLCFFYARSISNIFRICLEIFKSAPSLPG